jgi:hypothetical protein
MTAIQGENSITTMPREMRKQSIARAERRVRQQCSFHAPSSPATLAQFVQIWKGSFGVIVEPS